MISFFLSTPGPADDFWYGPVGSRTAAGIDVSSEVAMTNETVFACTRILSASGACLPLNLFRKTGNQRMIADDHRVHEMIHSLPNKETTSMKWRTTGIALQVNSGDYFAEIQRDVLGTARALWPILPPTKVEPYRADANKAQELGVDVMDLVWKVKPPGKPDVWIPDRDMFHVSSVSSDNGVTGKGVITCARESIAMGIATERQGAAYMKNSARPATVIVGGKFKDGTERENYRKMWVDIHGGVDNNGRPAMLPEGSELKTLGFSQEDSQFLATRQHNVEQICRWYGVAPHLVQHLLRMTNNNIEHQAIDFVVYHLIPWLKMWEEEIWRKLLTPKEQRTMYAKHNVDGLLRGDSAARAAFYKALWELGVLSINEIRDKEELNPVGPDGDKRFVQSSYVTLEVAGTPPPEPVPQQDPAPNEPDDDDPLSVIVDRQERMQTALNDMAHYWSQPTNGHAKIEDDNISKREVAIRDAAKLMIEETYSRLLGREVTALLRASGKTYKELVSWMDEFYTEHQVLLSDALRRPVQAYYTACGQVGDAESVAVSIATAHVQESRECVLRETEVQPERWSTLPSRFKEVTDKWREHRAGKCVATITQEIAS